MAELSASGGRRRVLIVGQAPSFARTLQQDFSDRSFAVETAVNADEAVLRVADAPPDLVVLDSDLPNDAARELARMWKTGVPGLAVILVSPNGALPILDELDALRESNERLKRVVASSELLLHESTVKNDTLIELGRFKDEVAAMIVHDLKNPLSVIVSNYDYILDGFEGSADCLEALQDSQNAGRRMIRLLANLVDVAHLEGKTFNVRLSPVLLTQLIQTITNQRRVLARSREISLVLTAAPEITAMVDVDLLTRAVENLIDNALRHALAGGSVEVDLRAVGSNVELRIGNSGAVIPIGARDTIFDKYQPGSPGVGRMSLVLGLYFCRLAIEAQGGQIWIEETARMPTVFGIRLPNLGAKKETA